MSHYPELDTHLKQIILNSLRLIKLLEQLYLIFPFVVVDADSFPIPSLFLPYFFPFVVVEPKAPQRD